MAETLCTPDAQHVAIPSCVFPDGAVPFMGNEDCVGVEDNGKLVFSPANDNCQITPRLNGTHIIFGGSVEWEQGSTTAVITRRHKIKIEWECAIATQYILSLGEEHRLCYIAVLSVKPFLHPFKVPITQCLQPSQITRFIFRIITNHQ